MIIIYPLLYGAFPLIYALCRKNPITSKKFTLQCWGVNSVLFVLYLVLAFFVQSSPSAFGFIFWTWIFSKLGKKVLKNHNLLILKNEKTYCPNCGQVIMTGDLFCSNCGKQMSQPESNSKDSSVQDQSEI